MNFIKWIDIDRKTAHVVLLAGVFCMILFTPLTSTLGHHEFLIRINFSLLLICSLLVVEKINNISTIVVAVMIAGQWLTNLIEWEVVSQSLRVIIMIAFFYTVINLIIQIAKVKIISFLVIIEAVNAYLLLGIVYALLVQFIVALDPLAYHVSVEADNKIGDVFNHGDTLYYAFTTMTTVGYGDIAPLSPLARSLSIIISVSGQIYLTTVLAVIVGKYANLQSDEA